MRLLTSLPTHILSRKKLPVFLLLTASIPLALFTLFAYFTGYHAPGKFKLIPFLIFICTAAGWTLWLNRKILSSLHYLSKLVKVVDSASGNENQREDDFTVITDCLTRISQVIQGKDIKIREVNNRLIALNAVATAVNQTLEVDQILNESLGIVLEVTGYDGGIIFLQDEDNQNLSMRTWKGLLAESMWKYDRSFGSTESDHLRTKLEGILKEVGKRKQIVFIPDWIKVQNQNESGSISPGPAYDPDETGIKTVSIVPLVAKGKVFGAITLVSQTLREPSLEENEFLEAVGQQIGMTIDNINLLSGLTQKAQDLSLLLETSGTFSASLDLKQVLNILTQRVMKTLKAELGWIFLSDEKKENVKLETFISTGGISGPTDDLDTNYFKYHRDHLPPEVAPVRIKIGEIVSSEQIPIHALVFSTGKMMRIGGEEPVSSLEKQIFFSRAENEAALMPLSLGNRVLGVMGVRFAESDKLSIENLNLCRSMISQAAFAIENAKLYEDVKQKAEEAFSLYQVAQRLSSILDGNELLDQILRVVVESFGYLNCAILLLDQKQKELYVRAAHGFSGDYIKKLRIKIDLEGITGWVARTGEPLVVGDISQDPRYIMGKDECKSEVAVPMKLKGEIIGVLDAESERLSAFGEKDVRILSQLASQIAIVLENSRLFAEEKKRYLQLALINDIGRKVISTLDLDKLLENAVEVIQLSLKYDNISLFLVDESSGNLLLKSFCGQPGSLVKPGYLQKKGVGMIGRAAETGRSILCHDVSAEPSYIPAIKETISELSVPIKSGKKVMGVLDVENFEKNTFDDQDVAVLETIADQLANAINNTRLYEDTQKKACRLELADQINRAISSTLDLKGIFQIISHELNKIMNYDRINIDYWCPRERIFKREMTFSSQERFIQKEIRSISADDTTMYEVVCTEKPYHREKLVLNRDSGPMDRLVYSEGIRSYVLIPIREAHEVRAVLSLESSKECGFEEEQIQLLSSIADHLSVAMQNAKLFSDLEKAYQDLKNTQSHMIQIERFRAFGEMASGVVHDFNNILASILGRIQLLLLKIKKGEGSPINETEKSLKVIEKSVMDGAKILARVREFVKEKSDITHSPVDLNGLLEDSLEMTRVYWKDEAFLAGIEIEIKKEFHATGMVMGDATELREVMTNLLLNAVDAMPQGGVLTLQTREDSDYVYMTVKDTGMGMTEEVKSKMFVPFYTTKGEKGTGLGLSLSFGIITQHQGEIAVESTPGLGSSLIIKLPRCSRVENNELVEETSLDRAHILVIEDERNIREVLDEILSSVGHTVTQAENGQEGIEFFQKHKIDLVITDLGMPGLSGWEVADQIKAIHPDTPVILSTGWGVNSDQHVLEKENVDRMINKPFNMKQILSLIGELLASRKKQDKVSEIPG
jgi:GAF domain-containing protein/CheY-like chemotaxis protein